MRLALLIGEVQLAEALSGLLQGVGHAIHGFDQEQKLRRALSRESFDLVLADGVLLGDDCASFVQRVRALPGSDLPVMLINCIDDEELLSEVLAAGAEDYISRPLAGRELVGRIGAVLRRRHPDLFRLESELVFGSYRFDLQTRTVWLRGEVIDLTEREFDLGLFLFRNIGRMISRGHIHEMIWQVSRPMESRTIDTHVSRLRRKLALLRGNEFHLSAVYGTGYRLERSRQPWVSELVTISLDEPGDSTSGHHSTGVQACSA
ncbi:response regulator transcription factor [Zoogloea dura]|jgi:two-component system response regulator RegX3|uniref:Response regulator transcription factor n=1 Tax=Zoogloea dura TaxID=2728840 RepID=A0A848G2Q2_9RHOO|nr:response regulator transcription factor [Zoogloea dura]NML25564.1 response regulator transcription factor [Zoogloea dura]